MIYLDNQFCICNCFLSCLHFPCLNCFCVHICFWSTVVLCLDLCDSIRLPDLVDLMMYCLPTEASGHHSSKQPRPVHPPTSLFVPVSQGCIHPSPPGCLWMWEAGDTLGTKNPYLIIMSPSPQDDVSRISHHPAPGVSCPFLGVVRTWLAKSPLRFAQLLTKYLVEKNKEKSPYERYRPVTYNKGRQYFELKPLNIF